MIKREEIANPDSCLNHATEDEPIFVFRPTDTFTFETIAFWLGKLKARYDYLHNTGHFGLAQGKPVEARMRLKIEATERHLRQLYNWQLKNPDKVKVPGFPASIKL